MITLQLRPPPPPHHYDWFTGALIVWFIVGLIAYSTVGVR